MKRFLYLRDSSICVIAAAVAGGAAGAAMGLVGEALTQTWPTWALRCIAVALAAPIAFELAGHRPPIPQRDRESPRRWYFQESWRWAWKTGGILGSAVLTRLGSWSWYLIPLCAMATESPWRGAVIWGVYGGLRVALSTGMGWPRFFGVLADRKFSAARLVGSATIVRRCCAGFGLTACFVLAVVS
jgi:hypothetical protein